MTISYFERLFRAAPDPPARLKQCYAPAASLP
jgi:hypothetical protein